MTNPGNTIVKPGFIIAVTLGALLLLAACGGAGRDDDGNIDKEGDVGVDSIQVGDCFSAIPDSNAVSGIPAVPCAENHKAEAYGTFSLAAGPFPGVAEVKKRAQTACLKRFTTFVGIDYNKSKLEMFTLHPLKETWDDSRRVTCVAYSPAGVTGTLKGAKR